MIRQEIIKNKLLQKGVNILLPESVYISENIHPERISENNVTIHPNCRITGKDTLIMDHTVIGKEAPVTLDDCQVGSSCHLNGGFFQNTVFSGHNVFGACAHVRKGTILEEQANAAHSVGLKQTILFPFVTLGSQINFCDCLMAGGTSRKNHSEVGSSFIHFNFTPNQDKATASLMGNVHQGVFLDHPPIFLGGQGGIVGPCRLGFGTITAAGCVIRKDETRTHRILLGGNYKDASIPARTGVYSQVKRIYNNNIHYMAGLVVLKLWYTQVRPIIMPSGLSALLLGHMTKNLDICFAERVKRFNDFNERLLNSKNILLSENGSKNTPVIQSHNLALSKYTQASDTLEQEFYSDFSQTKHAHTFLNRLSDTYPTPPDSYTKGIQNLDYKTKQAGTEWLEFVHDNILKRCLI